MQMVVLAGGLATRLEPLIQKIPKSMLLIHGKPFLEYQLDLLKQKGILDIVLCIGHLGQQIRDYFKDGKEFGVQIRYSEEKERLLGTGGALKKAQNLLEPEFFVMYGDSYLPIDYFKVFSYFKKFNKSGLVVVYKNFNRYDKSNVILENNLIKVYDKKKREKDMIYIDAGVSILKKEVFDIIPENQFVSLERVFQDLIKRKELLAFETEERFYEIGSIAGLKEFKNYFKER